MYIHIKQPKKNKISTREIVFNKNESNLNVQIRFERFQVFGQKYKMCLSPIKSLITKGNLMIIIYLLNSR